MKPAIKTAPKVLNSRVPRNLSRRGFLKTGFQFNSESKRLWEPKFQLPSSFKREFVGVCSVSVGVTQYLTYCGVVT
jgi:hypothetical protein